MNKNNYFLVLLMALVPLNLVAEISQKQVLAAQENYERKARIRTWVTRFALGAKLAMDTATFYRLIAPLWWQPVERGTFVPKKLTWLQWGKANLQETLVDVRNLALTLVVNKLASPLLQQLQEQAAVPVASSWFLAMRGATGHVVVAHDYAQFVQELETMDVALRTLLLYQGTDVQYQQTIITNYVALMERSVGYLQYQAARLQDGDKLASLTVQQVADALLKLTNSFCDSIELAIGSADNKKVIEVVSEYRSAWHEQCALLRTITGF